MRKFLCIIALLGLQRIASAQELLCNVEVNAERVQSQERQIFEEMENAISEFMNTTKWTDDEFEETEKIKCNILIILGDQSTVNNFQANVQIQSSRPVYGTDYETTMLNFFDNKWGFSYNISQPLIFAENTFTTELTSLLAFYAYAIIGMDYDSFSKLGGNPYFERVRNIAANSEQQSSGRGWTAMSDTRDRYWISENMNNTRFIEYREALYEYHRLGMDTFVDDPENARKVIFGALEKIEKVREALPTAVMVNSFFDSKAAELVNIFSQGDPALREQAIELLIRVDPTNANKYKKALKQ